jgi:sugar O-acyltransferase (sialic acid O-acetyltransferase NeuD family)
MKPKIILIGGGGHCKSSIDVIEQIGEFAIAGIVDKNQSIENLFGYPLLGNDENLSKLKEIYEYALITMGQINTPSIRMKLFEYTKSIGFKFPSIISNKAYVSKHAQISEGTIIMHGALINAGAVVGKNCIINTNALIEHDVIVGDHCHISTGAIVNGGANIGRGTFVGSNAAIKEYVKSKEFDFIKAGSLFKGSVND